MFLHKWVLANQRSDWCFLTVNTGYAVFSPNFSAAGKGPFMAGKAKKYVPEVHFPGGGEVVEWGTWLWPCCEI